MRVLFIAAALAAGGLTAPLNAAAAPQIAPAYSSSTTSLGDLVDNPRTRVIFDRYFPGVATNPQFGMARPMTLRQVQAYAPDMFTNEKLVKIDQELAKASAKK
jgi:para-nitrobenzyl esterase